MPSAVARAPNSCSRITSTWDRTGFTLSPGSGTHETEIEIAFAPDEGKTDLSKWLYNGKIDKAGDLGYWVGYRIVKSYYQHAADKRQAIRDIFEMSDPKAFLARSGWHPGIVLQ
jgi:hypothetical protein